jgi:hypothetical protein
LCPESVLNGRLGVERIMESIVYAVTCKTNIASPLMIASLGPHTGSLSCYGI